MDEIYSDEDVTLLGREEFKEYIGVETGEPEATDEQEKSDKGEFEIDKNNRELSLYFREVYKIPLLSAKEEIALARKARQGDMAARNKLVSANLRWVASIARRYMRTSRHLRLSDLIQAGNEGLMRAVPRFDPELGFRFLTYATSWIRQRIEWSIKKFDRTIQIPAYQWKSIQQHPGFTTEVSLQKPIGDDGDCQLGDLIPDEKTPNPESEKQYEENYHRLVDLVQKKIGELAPAEQGVILYRFGFKDCEDLSKAVKRGWRPHIKGDREAILCDVAELVHFSTEWTRQMERKALRKLRDADLQALWREVRDEY